MSDGGVKRAPLETAEVIRGRIAKEIASKLPLGWYFCLALASDDAWTYASNEPNDEKLVAMLRQLADDIESNRKGL